MGDGLHAETTEGEKFSTMLDELLRESPHSLRELERRTGIPATTLSTWRKGRHTPYARQQGALRRLLKELAVEDPQPWMLALTSARETKRDAVSTSINPYKGLVSFGEQDAHVFFGRDSLVGRLVERVEEHRNGIRSGPVMLVGASGSGKTSVLRAGLVAALSERGLKVRYAAASFSTVQDPFPIDLTDGGPQGSHDVLILDQFETVLSGALPGGAELVSGMATSMPNGSVVVIGLRADHYSLALEHPFLAEGLEYPIIPPALTDDRLADVIELPAQLANLTVEPRLTGLLLSDFGESVRAGAGEALPLLSHVLFKIVDQEGEVVRDMTVERYREVGGLEGALRESAEEAYGSLAATERELCRRLFMALVEVGRDGLPLRRSAALDVVFPESEFGTAVGPARRVADAFVSRRLLTVEQDSYAISHEALLRAWPRLADWIGDQREALSSSRRTRAAHHAWVQSDEDEGSLLAGAELEIATRLAHEKVFAGQLSPDERRFIEISERVELTRARRRTIAFRGALVVAGVLAVSLLATFLQFRSSREARAESESRQLALQASNLQELEPAMAAQLAVASHNRASTVESRSAVLGATGALSGARYPGGPGATALAVTPGGDRVVVSNSVTGSLTVLDRTGTGEYEERARLELDDPEVDVYGLAISPDGGTVAFGGTDLYANVWDIESGETAVLDDTLTLFQGAVQRVIFSPDGSEVFAGGTSEGGVGRWTVGSQLDQSTSPLIPADGAVMGVAVDDSMRLMATSNDEGLVRLWSLDDPGTPLWSYAAEGSPSAVTVSLSSDGSALAAGFRDGTFEVWTLEDPASPQAIDLDADPFASWTTAVDFSPSGRRLAVGSADGDAQVWDTETWTAMGSGLQHPNGVTNVQLVDDETLFLALADGSVRQWDLDQPQLNSLGAAIWSASFSRDGQRLLATSKEGAGLWNVETDGTLSLVAPRITSPDPDLQFTGEIRFSPDGSTLAAGTFQADILIMELVDDREFRTLGSLTGLESLVEALEYSPDGTLMAALGNRGELGMWRLDEASAAAVHVLEFEAILFNIAFSPDGSLLAMTDSTGSLHLFSVAPSGQLGDISTTTVATDSASGVQFHPDGSLIAVGSHDGSVSIWDVADPTVPDIVTRISVPNGRIHDVVFTADGDWLGASASDGAATLWDVGDPASPELEARLLADGQMFSLSFAPSGALLVGAGSEATVTAWNLDVESAIESLCSGLGVPLSVEDWDSLVPGIDFDAPC